MAIRHPQRVRRIVTVSALVSREGVDAGFWEFMKNASLETMPQELQDAYRRVAPNPENLRLFHDKAAQRMREFRDIPAEAIREIVASVLVVSGDADLIRPEHSVALTRLLPRTQLAILPDTDHMQVTRRVECLAPMVNAFLDRPE